MAPHAYGSWSESICTIFSPAEGMVRRNGPPLILNNTNSLWYNKNLVLPENSVILQEKENQQNFLVQANESYNIPLSEYKIKMRDSEQFGYIPKIIDESLEKNYSILHVAFSNLKDWHLLNRAIIHKMGYSYFPNSSWSDTRIDNLCRELKENFGMKGYLSIEDEHNLELLQKMQKKQEIILRNKNRQGVKK